MRAMLRPLVLSLVLGWTPAFGAELDARLKWFGTLGLLPEEDLQRQQSGTPAYDDQLDLRLMLRHRAGSFTWMLDHSTTLVRGDSLAFGAIGPALDQAAVSDRRRLADLTWRLSDGSEHLLVHRFDRLAVRYREGPWSVTAGRQSVSWGNGLVFQPLDLFNPFAPTAVDQDYKAGDDLVLVERALASGGSVQMLAVGRRDGEGHRTFGAGSFAGKLHWLLGRGELELVGGRHVEDAVLGAGLRFPVGGALVRSDLLATRLDRGGWKVSGIANTDYSLLAGGRNMYLFAEYFHSGFGMKRLPEDPAEYPEALLARLERGELFNLMRHYLAAGGTMEWHPLWSQTATLIGNLDDGSVLVQTQVSHEPDDRQRLELGLVAPLGSRGEEFGGVPVAAGTSTLGGGIRLYLRWAYYF